jgi:hypothetical protein
MRTRTYGFTQHLGNDYSTLRDVIVRAHTLVDAKQKLVARGYLPANKAYCVSMHPYNELGGEHSWPAGTIVRGKWRTRDMSLDIF